MRLAASVPSGTVGKTGFSTAPSHNRSHAPSAAPPPTATTPRAVTSSPPSRRIRFGSRRHPAKPTVAPSRGVLRRHHQRLSAVKGGMPSPCGALEGDVVLHVVELARRLLRHARRLRLTRLRANRLGARLARTGARAEHLHAVGDDLGGVAVLAFLVLPLARAQAP